VCRLFAGGKGWYGHARGQEGRGREGWRGGEGEEGGRNVVLMRDNEVFLGKTGCDGPRRGTWVGWRRGKRRARGAPRETPAPGPEGLKACT